MNNVMTNTSSSSSNLTKDQQEASLGLLTFSAGGSQSSSFSKEFMEDQEKFLNIQPQKEEDPQEAERYIVDNDEAGEDDGSKHEEGEQSS